MEETGCDIMAFMRKKRTIDREKEGYSLEEMRSLTRGMIDKMIVRLRKRLREASKKQAIAY